MTDDDAIKYIRGHLARTFISLETTERRVEKPDGSVTLVQVRRPHRFVVIFDELVRGYRR